MSFRKEFLDIYYSPISLKVKREKRKQKTPRRKHIGQGPFRGERTFIKMVSVALRPVDYVPMLRFHSGYFP